MIGWFFWDPDKIAFTLPFIKYPIMWYGVLFSLGFLVGFYILLNLIKRLFSYYPEYSNIRLLNQKAVVFSERLTLYIIIATIVGARIGHILFYERWAHYFLHPLEIIKTWEGGLASHGAIIGILIGVTLFYFRSRKEFPTLTISRILDLMVIPALFASTLIRIGNFINQEVLGRVSSVPWAIIFGHPIDGGLPHPRHPAQLYEAIFYFMSFLVFWRFFPKIIRYPGRLSGVFFIAVFVFRFLVEFIKEEQSYLFSHQYFKVGQILSVPMIFLGIGLCLSHAYKRRQRN